VVECGGGRLNVEEHSRTHSRTLESTKWRSWEVLVWEMKQVWFAIYSEAMRAPSPSKISHSLSPQVSKQPFVKAKL